MFHREPAIPFRTAAVEPAMNKSKSSEPDAGVVQSGSDADLEARIHTFGKSLLADVKKNQPGRLSPQYYIDLLMQYTMRDERLKLNLFRFTDVLPTLRSGRSVMDHAQGYFLPVADSLPAPARLALNTPRSPISDSLFTAAIRKQVSLMADNFIVGADADSAISSLAKIRSKGQAFTVDLVGEAAVSESESKEYLERYIHLLASLHSQRARFSTAHPSLAGHRSEKAPLNVSVKLSALYSQVKPQAFGDAVSTLTQRVAEIARAAKEFGIFLNFDMEDSSLVDISLATFRTLLESEEFRSYPHFGIVLQAYLKRSESDLKALIAWNAKRNVPITIRLVKGAYWDTETVLAIQKGWPSPVWSRKGESDLNYEKLSRILLDHNQQVIPAFASHNIRSLSQAICYAKSKGIDKSQYEIQTLYGMAAPIKKSLVDRGFLVREYCPVGELIPAMGYLVRRLLENTSNEGFLSAGLGAGVDADKLLEHPRLKLDKAGSVPAEETVFHGGVHLSFENEPLSDFSVREVRESFSSAIAQLQAEKRKTPARIRPRIADRQLECSEQLTSVAPEDHSLKLATIGLASVSQADDACRRLAEYFPKWSSTPVSDRAAMLRTAADIMNSRRSELAALITLEAGKPTVEADADVAEAIDFCRYYADRAEEILTAPQKQITAGEQNFYSYEPRGVCLVISPWNFPLAIPCGMTAAALVTGNTVIHKPAEQTSEIASALDEIYFEAGIPAQALCFLPARGESVAAHLATKQEIATICFTGSKAVGLSLIENGANPATFGTHVRRVITEMGGKNAIIIDEDADLDEAVTGVIQSAFGFSGQKCSACSRVLVVGEIYQRFCERFSDALGSCHLGAASDPKTLIGPLIDKESQQRVLKHLAVFRKKLSLLAEQMPTEEQLQNDSFVPAVAFKDVPLDHPVQSTELFAPVVAISHVATFEEACKATMNSEYALTAGVFSRNPASLELASSLLKVGNLYINRGCTGAFVSRQPFGGAAMSGVGAKAGGPDYLKQFLNPRTVTVNTMRRGFAPR